MAKQKNQSSESSDENSEKKDDQLSAVEKSHSRQDPPPTLLEWGIRGISLAIVLGVIGYLIYTGLQPVERPYFTFEVQTQEMAARNGKWVVPFDVTNQGDMSVHLLVVHCKSTKTNQELSLEIPLLGARETVTGEFWFDASQEVSSLEFSVESYLLP